MRVDKAEDYVLNDERLCSFIDDDDCRATFVYGYHNYTGDLLIWVQETKECPLIPGLTQNTACKCMHKLILTITFLAPVENPGTDAEAETSSNATTNPGATER